MWRYRELLPHRRRADRRPQVGGTPLVRADRLAEALGVEQLWIKNDAVNFPTLSFKDRVVSVALSKAREFGFKTVGCASTGNLANSVAANAAAAGLESYIFVPADLEADQDPRHQHLRGQGHRRHTAPTTRSTGSARRSRSSTAGASSTSTCGPSTPKAPRRWASRSPSSSAGGRRSTWSCPMAGGSLIGKIQKAFQELHKIGLIADPSCKIYGAQATGCNPISAAVKNGWDSHRPVRKPNTIAKSLAIGDPADGFFAAKVIRDSGGWAEDVSDPEIAEAMALLGRTEGIFAETAGGVTVAVARKLIEQGRIPRDEEIVLCITGNGLKTQDAVAAYLEKPAVIGPSLEEFEALVSDVAEPALV